MTPAKHSFILALPPLPRRFVLIFILLLLPIPQVSAASITVNSTCSLADAITSANTNTATGGCPAGSATGTDTITLTANITLSAALPNISSNIIIEGDNKSISGNNTHHIFFITSGPVTINNLTMQNGIGSNVRFEEIGGGAIWQAWNSGALTVSNSRFLNNSATPDSECSVYGGAIYAIGNSLTIEDSEFRGNASTRGAAIYAGTATTLTLRRSSFTGHKLPAGMPESCKESSQIIEVVGGGTISNVTVSGNATTAIRLGGGTTSISHSTFADNKDYTADNTDTSTREGGGIIQFANVNFQGRVNLYNNIIANNSPYDCSGTESVSTWLTANVNNLIDDNTCSPALSGDPKLASFRGAPGYRPLQAGSPAIDAAASAHCTDKDIRGVDRPVGDACDIGAYEYVPPPPSSGDGGGGGGGSGSGSTAQVDSIAPRIVTGEALQAASGIRVWAQYGLGSGIQFRRLGASGVGNAAVIGRGLLDAVDVWGFAKQEWEVCFPGSGALVFLDAAQMPRAPEPIAAYRDEDGYTCAEHDRAGTLVLAPGPPAPVRAASAQAAAPSPGRFLSGCMVTTREMIRFRDAPGGAPLSYIDPWGRQEHGWLPSTVTLTALERTDHWFKVDFYGTRGWVSADYVSPRGDCV